MSVYGLSCTDFSGTATSTAFAANIPLGHLANSTGGVGNVSTTAKPGTYTVTVTCGSATMTGSITVIGSAVTAPPTGGAATGDGASLVGGSSSGGVETGVLIALVGAGLGAVAIRRRRRARGQG